MPDFPIAAVRSHFPALSRHVSGQPAVYFDAPGGTAACDRAIAGVAQRMSEGSAHAGGPFATSIETAAMCAQAQAAMADLLGAKPAEIAFGPNMTSITFAVSRALARDWRAGDELIVTRLDHDANVAPWLQVAEDRGMSVRWLDFDPTTGRWSLDDLAALLGPKTRLVALGMASNALGTLNPVAEACVLVRARSDALTYIDAVQSVPHVVTDVATLGCDFLACSPYKFFGPHQGVLWMRAGLSPRAYKVRPAGGDGAHRFETGTPSFEGQAGVLGAIDYLEWLGGDADPAANSRRARLIAAMTSIAVYERGIGEHMLAGLATIPGLKLWGPPTMDGRVPTFSFTLAGHDPQAVSQHLADRGIFAWAGHFYAVEAIDRLGLAGPGGLLRVGLCHYSTTEEVDRLIAALRDL
ncbi:cysteine desulfurase-like protein [Sphingomonas bacterium]|uniref:cysteine desulfurase-like protein n=1 Tax=Sphingomonas bacterium TaxID=1895847 RepID=UPI002619413C|nr:cysteine desulfurase-like protein [Sphingomonas bacterium]MDB5678092.1 Cysteine desulfurase family protein [Sphingomonas bacterium]